MDRELIERRAILVTNILPPHRIPLFNRIDEIMRSEGILFKVIFYSKMERHLRRHWDVHAQEMKFDWVQLNNWDIALGEEKVFTVPYSLAHSLPQERPDVIVTGGFSANSIIADLYARSRRVPFIVWSGAVPQPEENRNPLRRLVRKKVTADASACIAYGSLARQYLQGLGLAGEKIFVALNAVDSEYFYKGAKDYRMRGKEIRKEQAFPRHNVLYVGRLTERKGVRNLLKTVRILAHGGHDFLLHLVGDGPQSRELEAICQKDEIENYVKFWGFKQREELPFFYGLADLFVFPSMKDVWGQVVVEAMASGLPVIASKWAGVTVDLIDDGVNGFVVDPRDSVTMADRISRLLRNENLLGEMGDMSLRIVKERASLEMAAEGFADAVRFALGHP